MSVQCECGKVAYTRCGVGPTGRNKTWMVRVDKCSCGLIYPASPDVLTKAQRDWVRRYNIRISRDNEKRKSMPVEKPTPRTDYSSTVGFSNAQTNPY